ncbi:glycosyltransferase family 2 protein [Christiangramia sediminis]|uniref:Glycosyltransferase family 2 protein n=1 Tax=Christiangramia sediminis TaxID=2881336 RepID=A0A9X1LJ41_9FLAO|nr:glycosyltransferase family A protein [Christiangramia sediminis]MCB7481331.1 glycosyltransferase family 2 protein [Christiangramia sediminis]
MTLYQIKRFYHLYFSYNTFLTTLQKIYHILEKKEFEDAVTIIITSSGRKEYLVQTITSLRKNLISKRKVYWYIIDDNPVSNETQKYIRSMNFDKIILNKKNRGLGYSLNRIYRSVFTKYIFHCEDDWEFLNEINLDLIISQLKSKEQLILNRKQPQKEAPDLINGEAYLRRYYSFNPHLVKYKSILKILPFSNKSTERTFSDRARENSINSRIYKYNKIVFVSHIGEKRTVKKY